MLEQIFLKVIDMSLAASLIILIVFLARVLLKRFPKYISYMLWSVVLFKLLCPFTFETKISIVPDLKSAFYEYALEKDDVVTETAGNFACQCRVSQLPLPEYCCFGGRPLFVKG